MEIKKIINIINPVKILSNAGNINITGISYNTKTLQKGDVFVCLIGEHIDSHNFIPQAIENGASCIIVSKEINDSTIPTLVVKDTKLALTQISELFYDYPSAKLNLIGVTGTNGKTTVTHLIQRIFEENGQNCGIIGTLGHKFTSKDIYKEAKHTTPQSPEFQRTLKNMLDNSTPNVIAEVSSHALEQHRVGCTEFKGAIFTNLTQDHLDYHITMDAYFNEKAKLFENLSPGNFAVINNDDEYSDKLKNRIKNEVKILTYGINNKSDVMAENIEFSTSGAKFKCITPTETKNITLQMTGLFSIYNVLAAICTGIANNIDLEICINALENTKGVAGRFETITKQPLTIVDYAHTPDGLLNVLNAAKKILPANGRLICIFGCGGDRDATKRPKMGQIAENIADIIIITSGNPRSEDPQQIITDILTGIKSLNSEKIQVEIDRKTAIKLASKMAKKDDIVVIAGKGHEDYQILKDKTIHFDDKEEVKKAFASTLK
ncbi:MAG: UDP-N-acetylmuramoyl-L-alanyl-D-glutamate--2,6-diaminopimelate ligase [Candidatus Gastranaerophilales bacterium]|nr:UDP-N-acetylmuramoyl-L-alanyl-D-glutamate--2,6-diaminopimelate ligase [Candidatus Gastranaerophilales bacterium]